jgi:hypothetical protein
MATSTRQPTFYWEGELLVIITGKQKRRYKVEIAKSDLIYWRLFKELKFKSGAVTWDLAHMVTATLDGEFRSCTCLGNQFHRTKGSAPCVHSKAVLFLYETENLKMVAKTDDKPKDEPKPETKPTMAIAEVEVATKAVAQLPRGVAITSLQELIWFGEMVERSRLAPVGMNAAGVSVCVQYGMELGISPLQSIMGMQVVKGKVGLSGDLAKALVIQSPECESFEEWLEDEKGNRVKSMPLNPHIEFAAVCETKRRGRPKTQTRVTLADAQRAGLWPDKNPDKPWNKYPQRMLRYRAMGFELRDNFGDVLRGLKTVEELNDYPAVDPIRMEQPQFGQQAGASSNGIVVVQAEYSVKEPEATGPSPAANGTFSRVELVKECNSFFFPRFAREKVAARLKDMYNRESIEDLDDKHLAELAANCRKNQGQAAK